MEESGLNNQSFFAFKGKRGKQRYMLFFFLLLLVMVPLVVQGKEKNSRIVRVGYYSAQGFQEYDEKSGEYSGVCYEYLMAIAQYTNWEYEFVPVNFSDGMQMLENGDLDLMNNVSKTKKREKYLGFSTCASGSNYGCLIVNSSDTRYAYNDYEAFQNMKVGVISRSIFKDYFEKFSAEHNMNPQMVYFDTEEAMNEAAAEGSIDARVVSSSFQDGSRVVAKFAPMDYYFAVPKKKAKLLRQLNHAMMEIEKNMPDFQENLEKRYAVEYVENEVVLSKKEKAYIQKHPEVTVAVNDSWYPISYFVDGTYAGPLADIYHEIEKATGIQFNFVRYKGKETALEAASSGETDMVAECPYNFIFANQRKLYLSSMVSEVGSYCVINENNYMGVIKKIALSGDTYMDERVKKLYGDQVEYIPCSSAENAVKEVLEGEADAAYINQYLVSTFQNRGKYISLHYMPIPELEYDFCLGISQYADAELATIVEKGLQTLDEDYYSNLFQMTAEMSSVPDFEVLFYQNPFLFILGISLLLVLLVVLVLFFFYRKKMEKKNRELQSAKEAQSDFLARMSHDMRTPMNGILGLSYLMEKENDSIKIKEYILKLQEASHYLLQLINDVLDVNKIESGELFLNPTVCEEEKIFRSIVEMIQPMAKEKEIAFSFEKNKIEWQYVCLDEQRVKQIFINLLSNAVKFTPKGGRVDFKMEFISKTEKTIQYKFVICDSGIGISEDFLPYIFEPFKQEKRDSVDAITGTGLGLSIVKQLVELMEGTIQVKSEENKGTEFTLYLNFSLADWSAGEIPGREAGQGLQKPDGNCQLRPGLHILLCEDHPLNAMIATKLLEQQEAVVTWAKDGKEGVEIFAQEECGAFDMILMDIRMPKRNGLEAAREIRAMRRPDAAEIPIIAMSANAYEEDVKSSLAAGMNEHLAKPVEPQELYKVIAKYFH